MKKAGAQVMIVLLGCGIASQAQSQNRPTIPEIIAERRRLGQSIRAIWGWPFDERCSSSSRRDRERRCRKGTAVLSV